MKNASTITIQQNSRIRIVGRLVSMSKPENWPVSSSSGCAAVNPDEATKPGRIRSAALSEPPLAFSPMLENELKTMPASDLKLPMMKANAPT